MNFAISERWNSPSVRTPRPAWPIISRNDQLEYLCGGNGAWPAIFFRLFMAVQTLGKPTPAYTLIISRSARTCNFWIMEAPRLAETGPSKGPEEKGPPKLVVLMELYPENFSTAAHSKTRPLTCGGFWNRDLGSKSYAAVIPRTKNGNINCQPEAGGSGGVSFVIPPAIKSCMVVRKLANEIIASCWRSLVLPKSAKTISQLQSR